MSVQVAASPVRCPFCHAGILLDAEAWSACAGCLARHHDACWGEAVACATCGSRRRLRHTTPRREPCSCAVCGPTPARSGKQRWAVLELVLILTLSAITLTTLGRFLGIGPQSEPEPASATQVELSDLERRYLTTQHVDDRHELLRQLVLESKSLRARLVDLVRYADAERLGVRLAAALLLVDLAEKGHPNLLEEVLRPDGGDDLTGVALVLLASEDRDLPQTHRVLTRFEAEHPELRRHAQTSLEAESDVAGLLDDIDRCYWFRQHPQSSDALPRPYVRLDGHTRSGWRVATVREQGVEVRYALRGDWGGVRARYRLSVHGPVY